MPTRTRKTTQKTATKPSSKELARQINSVLGNGTVNLGSDPQYTVKYIPTNVLPIDVLLQGGIPRGRITELYGAFSTLKSYLGLCTLASAQAGGGTAVLVDTEHSYDPAWAGHVGVDTGSLILSQPETGEQAVDAVQLALASGADAIVWDSIAATQPRSEAEVQLSGNKNIQPARLAALMSVALRRLNSTNKGTAIVCINQTRQKVGIAFGNPETTPGGRSLPFFASYRLSFNKAGRITRTRRVYDGEGWVNSKETVIQKIRVTLEKSKLSRPDRDEYFQWNTQTGEIELIPYLIAVGLEHGLIRNTKTGRRNTWTLNGKTYTEREFAGSLAADPALTRALTELAWGRAEEAMRLLRSPTPRGPRKRASS